MTEPSALDKVESIQPEDIEFMYGLAVLVPISYSDGVVAVWGAPPYEPAMAVLTRLNHRYDFIVWDDVLDGDVGNLMCRQLRSDRQLLELRVRLGERVVAHYEAIWQLRNARHALEPRIRLGKKTAAHYESTWRDEQLNDPAVDVGLALRNPAWQSPALDLLNAYLWAQPRSAVPFLAPSYVDGVVYDVAFARSLLDLTEPFRSDNTLPLPQADVAYMRRLAAVCPAAEITSEQFAADPNRDLAVVDLLLQAPGMEPRHLAALHLWRGLCLAGADPVQTLAALDDATHYLPSNTPDLARSIDKAYNNLRTRLLTPVQDLGGVPDGAEAWRTVTVDPRASAFYVDLGDQRRDQNHFDEAIAAYTWAIALDPTRSTAYHNLGGVYADIGDFDHAVAAFMQAIRLNPAFAESHNGLGVSYASLGRYEEALPTLQQAAALAPRDAPIHNSLGIVCARLGRVHDAEVAFKQAIAFDPTLVLVVQNLGELYRDQGRYEDAIPVYQRAIALDPANAAYYHHLADVSQAVGRYDDAIVAFSQMAALDPRNPNPHNSMGLVYNKAGRYDEAIAAFRRSSALNPENAFPYNGLGNVYASMGRYDEALAAFEQAFHLAPEDAQIRNNLGDLFRDMGRYDEAIWAYEWAIGLAPQFATPHIGRGSVLWRLGEHAAAIKAFRNAITLNPNKAKAHVSLAAAARKQGKDRTYRKHIALAAPLMAAENAYNRACFAAVCDRVDEALDLLQTSIAHEPGLRSTARRDPDFDFIRDDGRFRALVGED